jgi:hypothetical protein
MTITQKEELKKNVRDATINEEMVEFEASNFVTLIKMKQDEKDD